MQRIVILLNLADAFMGKLAEITKSIMHCPVVASHLFLYMDLVCCFFGTFLLVEASNGLRVTSNVDNYLLLQSLAILHHDDTIQRIYEFIWKGTLS